MRLNKEKVKIIKQMSLVKTLYVNLKLFPIKIALRLPLIVGKRSTLHLPRGSVKIEGPIQPGMIAFGIGGSSDLLHYESRKNYFGIKNGGCVTFKGKAHFSTHVSILAVGSEIVFGKGFSCNVGCRFSSVAGLSFGDNCLFGGNCVVRDTDGHSVFDYNNGVKTTKHTSSKPIVVGDHVWVANNVSILKGVTIGSENIVGYGSTVVKSILGEHQIAVGVPAKIIKADICWER